MKLNKKFNFKLNKCTNKRHKWVWKKDLNNEYVGICKYCKEVNDNFRQIEKCL
jgi:hypothetical protein